jgi:hypothetical protein
MRRGTTFVPEPPETGVGHNSVGVFLGRLLASGAGSGYRCEPVRETYLIVE